MNILESFKKSISSETKDIIGDNLEVALDKLVGTDLINDIPIIKTMIGVWNFSNKLNQNFEIRKILAFLFEQSNQENSELIVAGVISHDDYTIHVEEILQILSRQDDLEKAQIIGKIFKSLLEKKIRRSDFLLYSKIIEKVILNDIKDVNLIKGRFIDYGPTIMNSTYREVEKFYTNDEMTVIHRLQNLGLILTKQYLITNDDSDKSIYGSLSIYTNYFLSPIAINIFKYVCN